MSIDVIVEYISLHFITVITFFLAFATISHMLVQRKKPSVMIAWTAVIIFIPYIGILVYLIFNGRKITKNISNQKRVEFTNIEEKEDLLSSPLEEFLRQSNIAGATNKNNFYLCENSVDTYEQIKERLIGAQKSIYISTYIYGDDNITQNLLDILTEKVKSGVEVKLLIDSFGSLSLEIFPKILQPFKDAGGEYHFFMSVLKHPIKNRLNFRNHRKMIIVDNTMVISGGINISKEYLSKKGETTSWCDLSFIIEGTASLYYRSIFQSDWEFQTDKKLNIIESKLNQSNLGTSTIQVVPSGPDIDNDALYESILYALYLAKKRVWIVTPYFVPDGSLMDALIIAKHRGVDIKIVLPKTSDHYLVDVSRNGYLRDLQKEKIQILFYKPKMLHAKAMLIDKEIAIVGSLNFDARSFFYNFEVMSFLYSKNDIMMIDDWVSKLFTKCDKGLKPASKVRVLFESFFKMLSPAL